MVDKCLEWPGAKNSEGYGHMVRNNKWLKIHRLVVEASLGRRLNPSELVCHHCDNPACYRLSHLYVGTNATNTQDKFKRNRFVPSKGEDNGSVKLTEKEVKEIRNSVGLKQIDLAKKYNISQSQVSSILTKKSWKHV